MIVALPGLFSCFVFFFFFFFFFFWGGGWGEVVGGIGEENHN